MVAPTVDNLLRWLGVAAINVAAVAVNAAARVVLRYLTRRAVRRALAGRGWWRLRLPRLDDGDAAEQRRLQRADAAAHMFARLASLVVGLTAALAIGAVLELDPVLLLALGAMALLSVGMGGRSLIEDWLTGLVVLLEDRYAVGDRVTVRVGAERVTGTVETLSGIGLRLRLDDRTTWHVGHGSIDDVRNHSQGLVETRIEVPQEVLVELDQATVASAVTAAGRHVGLADVQLGGEVSTAERDGRTTVIVRATRSLSRRQRRIVADRIADCDPVTPDDHATTSSDSNPVTADDHGTTSADRIAGRDPVAADRAGNGGRS